MPLLLGLIRSSAVRGQSFIRLSNPSIRHVRIRIRARAAISKLDTSYSILGPWGASRRARSMPRIFFSEREPDDSAFRIFSFRTGI